MMQKKPLRRSIWKGILASTCEEYFLQLRIREEVPMDSPVCEELAQFQELRNVCKAAYSAKVK